jgi:hypothetical protein
MKYASFDALASRLTAITPPVEGEEAGEACRQCGRRARYTQDERGRWRLVMTHAPHAALSSEEAVPDLRPPTRTDERDPFAWLNE